MGFLRRLFGGRDASPEAGSASLDPEQLRFRKGFAREARKVEGLSGARELDGFRVELTLPGGGQLTAHLDTVFLEARALPASERDAFVHGWVAAAVAQASRKLDTTSWEEVAPLLRPVLREIGFLEGAASTGPDGLPASLEVLPFLHEVVGIDGPGAIAYVSRERVEGWGRPLEAVLARARENALAVAQRDLGAFDPKYGPAWIVMAEPQDVFAATRLALPGFLASFAGKVEGRPIAIIPERSFLLVGGDAHPEAVLAFATLAREEWQKAPRRVSPAVYRLSDDGEVEPCPPDGPPERADAVRLGHDLLAASAYGDTKDALQTRLGEGVFVGSASLASSKKGSRCFTWTTAPLGVPSYLPLTELVGVALEGEPSGFIRRERLEELVGGAWPRVQQGLLTYLDARSPLPGGVIAALRAELTRDLEALGS